MGGKRGRGTTGAGAGGARLRGVGGSRARGPPGARCRRHLQHNPAEDETQDHAQGDSDNAGDQEGVVKDIFTNAG